MSAEAKRAVIQSALDSAYVFKQNAVLRNALPECPPRQVIPAEPPPDPGPVILRLDTGGTPLATASATAHPSQPSPNGTAQAPAADKWGWLKPALIGAAATLGGVGGLGGIYSWLNSSPAPPPSPVVIEQQGEQGLLQWLQEQGQHLPPAGASK